MFVAYFIFQTKSSYRLVVKYNLCIIKTSKPVLFWIVQICLDFKHVFISLICMSKSCGFCSAKLQFLRLFRLCILQLLRALMHCPLNAEQVYLNLRTCPLLACFSWPKSESYRNTKNSETLWTLPNIFANTWSNEEFLQPSQEPKSSLRMSCKDIVCERFHSKANSYGANVEQSSLPGEKHFLKKNTNNNTNNSWALGSSECNTL